MARNEPPPPGHPLTTTWAQCGRWVAHNTGREDLSRHLPALWVRSQFSGNVHVMFARAARSGLQAGALQADAKKEEPQKPKEESTGVLVLPILINGGRSMGLMGEGKLGEG